MISHFKIFITKIKKAKVLDIITYAFVLLFVYTALSKWLLYSTYLYDLGRSPELAPYAIELSILVPGSELLVAGLLLFTKTRKYGLYGALTLMLLFTGYVLYVLCMTTERPCTCGGIIRELSWRAHFVFNVCFTVFAVWGLWLLSRLNQLHGIK